MTILLKVARFYIPPFFKKGKLLELFHGTAAAFGCDAPSLARLSFDESLLRYALFTRDHALQAIKQKRDQQEIQRRLFESAFRLGQKFRYAFHLSTTEQAMAMGKILYRALGMDFCGTPSGEIEIKRCYFSQFYSPQVCQMISFLDEGLLAGLAGGGSLTFSQRITEGEGCCKALFTPTEGKA